MKNLPVSEKGTSKSPSRVVIGILVFDLVLFTLSLNNKLYI